jgi:hypothetical protein
MAQDTRTVTEPVFPPVCTVLTSQMAIVGVGPASETTPDTARLQAALTACPAGKAVELSASGGNYAFLTAPFNIPSGVSLIVDGGVTLFASRNREDYQTAAISSSVDECGTDGVNGNGCKNLISFANGGTNANSGIYGYGVIDGRGYATTLKAGADTGVSWWQNADNYVSPQSQNNPIMMKFSKSTNFTLYKITLRNSPEFHVGWAGSGFTAWGIKIQAPFTAHNTDGIDPDGTNVTITNSSISDGDDNVAVGASSAASNITVSNVTTYSGHGISVGSYTQGGLQNMLVTNVNMAGTAADGNATGIRLKSSQDRGGLLNNVTYQNMCVKDMRHILQFTPFYNTNSGSLIPQFANITLQNIHFLSPTVNTLQYLVALQGHDASHASTITLNNIVFDSLLATNVTSTQPEYETFTLGPGPVYPAFLQSLTGPGVAYVGSAPATQTGAYDCTSPTTFPYVVGELYLSTAAASNLQTGNVSSGSSFTLNAMVQPAMATQGYSGTAGSYTGAAALTNPINFLEGTKVVGTATLGANGTLASLTLSGVTPGTHTYTALYPGDANYTVPIAFGHLTVTVSAATAASTTVGVAANNATSAYGASTILTATVSAASGTPTGSVTFLDGVQTLATVPVTGTTAVTTQVLGGGINSITAVYSGDANFTGSTSAPATVTVAPATPTVTAVAAPATLVLGAGTVVTATTSHVAGGSYPTGTITLTEGTTAVGTGTLNSSGVAAIAVTPATVAAHNYIASYGGDNNYATASAAAVSVTATIAPTATVLTAPATLAFNAPAALTATVSASGSTPSTTVPTGTVKFMDGTNLLATVTLTNGVATLSQALSVGANSLTAVYSGDTNFSGSTSAAVTTTEAMGVTTVALGLSAASISAGGSEVLTATVSAPSGVTATGTVTFSNGGTSIGTATLNAQGVATLTVVEGVAGTQSITATYAGSATLAGSASSAATLTVVPVFTMTPAPATVYLSAGGGTPVTVTTAPIAGFGGTVAFTCMSPVVYVTCTMTPASVTVASGAGASTLANIAIGKTATGSLRGKPFKGEPRMWLAMLLPLGLLALARKKAGWLRGSLLAAVVAALFMGLSGCGGGATTTTTPANLPPIGANNVTVTATSGAVTGTTVIVVNVLN